MVGRMFSLSRTAEAVVPRWARKRFCQFFLKKTLGELFLGNLDLDQIDVGLADNASIQLGDLALNVDYLNKKLAGAAVVVKEGSIASLSIKIAYTLDSCQIEVEELELVLAPYAGSVISAGADCHMSSGDGEHQKGIGSGEVEQGVQNNGSVFTSLDVHEGVKTIAKIVKWLLMNFHIRFKNLIIAFDPSSNVDGKKSSLPRSLLLRIAEAEYGTCVSQDISAVSDSKCDPLLLMGKLTNFIRFQGAAIEFLQIYDADSHPQVDEDLSTSFSQWFTGNSSSGHATSVLSGASGGFSGTLNMSIPWKNGSLDICRVDADVSFEPMELRIHQSTIEWMIALWESLKTGGASGMRNVSRRTADPFTPTSRLSGNSSTIGSAGLAKDTTTPSREMLSKNIYSTISQDTPPDALLSRTNVINNWVPLYVNQEEQAELEPDYGASIDQFFECFDGMRSSQASLGNSGLWNWTYSVFSAITVASNLASGSELIPSEQEHVETNLRANIVDISIILLLNCDDWKHPCDPTCSSEYMKNDYGKVPGGLSTSNILKSSENGLDSYMSCLSLINVDQFTISEVCSTNIGTHFLETRCQNVLLNLQFFRQRTNFEASIMHIEVNEYYDCGNNTGEVHFPIRNCMSSNRRPLSKHLQREVEGVLPPFSFSVQDHDSKEISVKDNDQRTSFTSLSNSGLCKVELLASSGIFHCQYAVCSTESNGTSRESVSFSVNLPPLILCIDLQLVNLLLDLCKQVLDSFERDSMREDSGSGVDRGRNSSSQEDVKSGSSSYITTVTEKGNVQGTLIFPKGRIILCFPSEKQGAFRKFTSWNEFIVLDLSPSVSAREVPETLNAPKASSGKGNFGEPLTSICLNMGNLESYLVTSPSTDSVESKSCCMDRRILSARKVFSLECQRDDHNCGISMVWQKGPVTGPWMASRAWTLAATYDQRKWNKVSAEGGEYSCAATAEDLEVTSSHIRQELILSSASFLHLCFSSMRISVSCHDYHLLSHLLNQVISSVSVGTPDAETDKTIKNEELSKSDCTPSQTSVLVECDLLELCITLDEVLDVSHSLQKELRGSWNWFRLTVEKFEFLSSSNIGGIHNANFLCLKHGEGELRGSIIDRNGTPEETQDLLLISCRNSVMKRGDGEGANALSFGSAGTTVTLLWNPQLLQSFTSIVVRCGTIIAPGGRLDWINAVLSFFSSPQECDVQGDDGVRSKSSVNDAVYGASFFLDMVDIALSYEPHTTPAKINSVIENSRYSTVVIPSEGLDEQSVACILAAASLNVSNHSEPNCKTKDYKFQLQDIGLLICESRGSQNDRGYYHVDHLRKAGYVKVAQDALVVAILRSKDVVWEVDCSDSHFNLQTCHDTTSGLVRLIAQLQQLYAPNVEDALVHLQSRWDTFQQSQDELNSIDLGDIIDGSSSPKYENLSPDIVGGMSLGLLDGIVENVFCIEEVSEASSENGDMESHVSLDGPMLGEGSESNVNTSRAGDSGESGMGAQVIESYYISESVLPSKLNDSGYLLSEDHGCRHDTIPKRDVEYGKGRWYNDGSVMIVEDHISRMGNKFAAKQLSEQGNSEAASPDPAESCGARGKILLKNINVRWRMSSGRDWSQQDNCGPSSSDSIGRDGNVCLELLLSGLNLHYDIYPDGEICVSKLSLSVHDFHIYDRSKDAPWKMVLGYYYSKDRRRESGAKAFKLDMETVKPDPSTPLEEYRLHLEFLPIRLHLDQSQLNFFMDFFGNNSSVDKSLGPPKDLAGSEMLGTKRSFGSQTVMEEALLPFFQKCDVRPVVVRVDYIPRHIDLAALKRGNYAELLNLVPWKGIDLQLKHVSAIGVYGWNNICETVLGEWLEDISHNQVHKLLKGLPPIRSLFAVSSGASKLVSLPIKSYKKDHRLLKGMQRGAVAFIRSISLEAVGLGVHLAAGAHEILLQTEYILTSVPPSVPLSQRTRRKATVRSNQPKDTQQGIRQAYETLSDGLGRTASALISTPLRTYQRGAGAGSALATAVRAAPGAAIAPVSASARAVHYALLGVRNSLDPEHKRESMDKYHGPS